MGDFVLVTQMSFLVSFFPEFISETPYCESCVTMRESQSNQIAQVTLRGESTKIAQTLPWPNYQASTRALIEVQV